MMSFFSSEVDDVVCILHQHNFIQKTIQPIHIPLSRDGAIGWLLQMMMLWWCRKSENENIFQPLVISIFFYSPSSSVLALPKIYQADHLF